MQTFIFYALICLGVDAEDCQAYELDHGLSEEKCDNYFTDSGLDQVELLLALYVPNYRQGEGQVILSCDNQN